MAIFLITILIFVLPILALKPFIYKKNEEYYKEKKLTDEEKIYKRIQELKIEKEIKEADLKKFQLQQEKISNIMKKEGFTVEEIRIELSKRYEEFYLKERN